MLTRLPNPENATLEELFSSMHSSPTKKGFLRLQAIYFLLQGHEKEFVAKSTLTSVVNLNRWIRQYNKYGIDGLIDKPRKGRPPLIDEEGTKRIRELLNDPLKAGCDHWTLIHLHGYLKEEMDLRCSYSTFVRKVHKEGFVLRVPRPCAVEQDEKKRNAYLEKLKQWEMEGWQIWYIDETGIEGDPRPRRRWVQKGESPRIPYSGEHLRESVIGAVCPEIGQLEALQIPYCDSEFFQLFLDQLAKTVIKQKVLLILDRASWHRAKKLDWHGMKHDFLSPYSPDFNPIERLWLIMKARFFTDWIAKTPEQLTDRITFALKSFFNNEPEVKSICKT